MTEEFFSIYQENNTFQVLPKKYTLNTGGTLYFRNTEEAEEYIKEYTEFNGKGLEVVSEDDYELTKAQKERFEKVKNIKHITLDEVRIYVFLEKEPVNNAFWLITKKDEEIEKLKTENQSLMFGMLDIANKLSELSTK